MKVSNALLALATTALFTGPALAQKSPGPDGPSTFTLATVVRTYDGTTTQIDVSEPIYTSSQCNALASKMPAKSYPFYPFPTVRGYCADNGVPVAGQPVLVLTTVVRSVDHAQVKLTVSPPMFSIAGCNNLAAQVGPTAIWCDSLL